MSNVIVQGDSGTVLSLVIKDGSNIIDLTNATVEVLITYKSTGVIKLATITEPLNGKCNITLSSEDVMYEGTYAFQATVYFEEGTKFSSDIQRFTVTKKIGYIPSSGGGGGSKTLISESSTNGNIRVDGLEMKIYDDTSINLKITDITTDVDILKNSDVIKRLGISANGVLTIDGVEQVLDDTTSPIDGGTFTSNYNTNIVDGGVF